MSKRVQKFAPVGPGSTLGVIAVSAPTESERFARGLNWLKARGYQVKVALDPCREYGEKRFLFSSDSAANRAEALHELFGDETVAAIVTVRGAYGSMELLPLLDFNYIKKNPKPLIGFSDVSALLLALYQKAGCVSVHGASIESMSRAHESAVREANCSSMLRYLAGGVQDPFGGFEMKTFQAGDSAEGPLLVSNLNLCASLMGTKFEPDFAGHIVCFEEIGERPFRIHRNLLQMKLAGKFENVKGVVLGSFTDCSHPKALGPDISDVFRDIFGSFHFPVLCDAPFGHAEVNRPLALGVRARIGLNKLEFLELPVLD